MQKVLAAAGIASRRASEELIQQGRVQVNGQTITELGTRVDPAADEILIDGEPLPKLERFLYILLNKPIGVHSTTSDERGRRTVLDLVPMPDRVYPVGRLDADSEGLILLTNDGALTERMTHPRYGHAREYRVLVFGVPDQKALGRLRRGLVLEDGPTGPAEADVLAQAQLREERLPFPEGNAAWLKMVIREGRKRQVRRMCEAVGHPVMRLIRVGMGPLSLGDLPTGAYRTLTDREIARLRDSVGMGRKRGTGERAKPFRPRASASGAGESRVAGARGPDRDAPAGKPAAGRKARAVGRRDAPPREAPVDRERARRPKAASPVRDEDRTGRGGEDRPPGRSRKTAGEGAASPTGRRTPTAGRRPASGKGSAGRPSTGRPSRTGGDGNAAGDRRRGPRAKPGPGRKRERDE